MTGQTTELEVRKSILVRCSPECAFETFTDGIRTWWPLETHSLGEARAVSAAVEGRVGGRLFEIWDDGSEHLWGTVSAWEPPRRLAVSWHVNADDPAPTEWEVRFEREGDGTRVELQHFGWERLGERARTVSEGYDTGWSRVLSRYEASLES